MYVCLYMSIRLYVCLSDEYDGFIDSIKTTFSASVCLTGIDSMKTAFSSIFLSVCENLSLSMSRLSYSCLFHCRRNGCLYSLCVLSLSCLSACLYFCLFAPCYLNASVPRIFYFSVSLSMSSVYQSVCLFLCLPLSLSAQPSWQQPPTCSAC